MQKNTKRKIASMLMAGTLLFSHALSQCVNAVENEVNNEVLPIINVDVFTDRADFNDNIISANHRFNSNGYGMYDAENGKVFEDFVKKTSEVNYGLIRYPAGTIGNLFKWKDSIGPVEERKNVVLANRQRLNEVPLYGVDEHMRYVEQIGASAIYMVAEASETPQDAADLVEYLNAPNDGSNPGGGIDWAAIRAKNGHPEPYGVKYFEIGNEMNSADQRYWLDYPSLTGKTTFQEKYTLGDTVKITDEPARKYGTWVDNESRGEKNEEFYSQYYPVDKGSQTIYVNGTKWTEVSSFSGQSADAQVYVFDAQTGKILFGDGTNGKIPSKGAKIRMDYNHTHAGFEAYYDAMKAIDPDIVIVSCLEKVYEYIGDKSKCDGIVKHNYPWQPDAKDARGLHDAYMNKAEELINNLVNDDATVKAAAGRNDVVLATTEYGIIPISSVWTDSSDDLKRDEARILSRGLHFATILVAAAQTEKELLIHQGFTAYSFGGGAGLGSAGSVYNALYAQDPNDPSVTIESAMALAYKMFGNGHGDIVLNSFVQNNPVIDAQNHGDYDTLRVLASKDEDGTVYLFVINRDPENNIDSVINLNGFNVNGTAKILTLNGESYISCNTPDHPNDVYITESEKEIAGSVFAHSFPAHSIVVLKLSGEETGDKWQNNFDIRDFEDVSIGTLPAQIKKVSQEVAVVADPDNSSNKVLAITRTGNGKGSARASLSGENMSGDVTGYEGAVRIVFRLKAGQSNSRLNMQVKAGNATVMNLAFDNGMLMCNSVKRCFLTANEWHDVEFILDCKAKQYMMYVDGEYVHSARQFNNKTNNLLDGILFDVENQNATFYVDDLLVQTLPIGTGAVIGTGDVFVTTERGVAPTLPTQVKLISDLGNTLYTDVSWEEIPALCYGAPGMFTVKGNASGQSVTANVTVTERSVKPDSIEIRQFPNKMEYRPGDKLDITGMMVAIKYPDGVEAITDSGFELSYDFSKSGTVTLSVGGIKVTFEVKIINNGWLIPAIIGGIAVAVTAAVALFIVKKKKNKG